MLAAWGTRGVAADAAKARALYRKAFGLGVAARKPVSTPCVDDATYACAGATVQPRETAGRREGCAAASPK